MRALFVSLFAFLISFSAFWSVQLVPPVSAEGPLLIAQTPERSSFYDGGFIKGDEAGEKLNAELYTLKGITTRLLPGIANYTAGALAAVAVIFLIYAGYLFLTSEGDMDKAKTAIKSAFYTILGLGLLMFAYALVYLFLTLFGSP